MKPRTRWSREQYEEAGRLAMDPKSGLAPESLEQVQKGIADFEADARDGWAAPIETRKSEYYPEPNQSREGAPHAGELGKGRYKEGPRGQLLADAPVTGQGYQPTRIGPSTVDEYVTQVGRFGAGIDEKLQSASKARALYSSPVYRAPPKEATQGGDPRRAGWPAGPSKDSDGQDSFIYNEPSVAEMDAYLRKSIQNVDRPEYVAHWEKALSQLALDGEKSDIYKEMADRRWMEWKGSFQRNGASIVRAQYAGPNEEVGYLDHLSTQAQAALEPFASGLDLSVTLGLGRQAITSLQGNQVHGKSAARALKELEESGLALPMGERGRGASETKMGFAGQVAGMFTGGAASMGAKVIGKTVAKVAPLLRGTRMGSGITGALSGGAESLMTSGIERGGEVLRGDKADPNRDRIAEAIGGTVLGSGGGVVSHMISDAGGGIQRGLRRGAVDGRARDLGQMREHLADVGGGSETSFRHGITETPQMRRISEESLEPVDLGGAKVHLTPEQHAMRGLPEAAQVAGARAERRTVERIGKEKEAFYKKYDGQTRHMAHAAKELMRVANLREGVPFADPEVATKALAAVTELTPVKSMADAVMHKEASGFLRVMSAKEAVEAYGEEFVAAAARNVGSAGGVIRSGQYGRSGRGFNTPPPAFVVKAKKLNPREYDTAMDGIDQQINFDAARQKDPMWEGLRSQVMRDRDTFPGGWGDMKAKHHASINQLEARQRAFGLGGSFRKTSEKDIDQIRNVLQGASGATSSADRHLYEVLSENPELLRQFRTMRAVGARGRLKAGDSNVPGSMAEARRTGFSQLRLRTDPMMQLLERRFGAGGRTGILAPDMDLAGEAEKRRARE